MTPGIGSMYNLLFVSCLALFLTPLFIWSFKSLPQERWQIICAVPIRKMADGTWQGLNLTYYGLFNALALCAGVMLVLMLTGASGINVRTCAAVVIITLACCLPGSRLIARWVEKRPNTFSVGAASFLGIIIVPWIVLIIDAITSPRTGTRIDTMAVMSALMVGYAIGEGIGRLACISFGCCYGRPIGQMHPLVQRYLSWATFTYTGGTKKIAYAHRLDEEKIFAVQAFTAVFYSSSALVGTLLVLNQKYARAYFACLLATQGWRFVSEFFRSDYRGDLKISVYQIMSLLTIPYGGILSLHFPSTENSIDLLAGLRLLWDPAVILFIQALGIIMFLRTGMSQVTGSGLSFHVCRHRIEPDSCLDATNIKPSACQPDIGFQTPSMHTDS